MNVAKAGRSIPVKFSLNGDQGLEILAESSPTSLQQACPGYVLTDVIEETTDAENKVGLTYDPETDQYNYVWKTRKSWSGTCRQLTLRLNDGTDHIATFQFE
jgi:hypothetical protein